MELIAKGYSEPWMGWRFEIHHCSGERNEYKYLLQVWDDCNQLVHDEMYTSKAQAQDALWKVGKEDGESEEGQKSEEGKAETAGEADAGSAVSVEGAGES